MRIFFFMLLALCIYSAEKKEILRYKGKPVTCEADKLEYNWVNKILSAKGKVKLSYDNMTLEANKVEWDLNTNEVKAEGNIILKEGENELRGVSVVYNLKTKKGVIQKISVTSGVWHLSGSRIEKTAKDGVFYDGEMTTCNKKGHPHYKLVAKKIYVKLDEKISASNMFFYVGPVPILWIPYISRSLKNKRSPLEIKPGFSTSEGFSIKTTYNYFFNPLLQGEIHYDYLSRIGNGFGITPKYELPGGGGKIRTYYFRDRLLNKARWQLNFDHNQKISDRIYANGSVNFSSDEDIQSEIYSTPTVSRYLQSRFAVTYNSPFYTITTSAEEYDSWNTKTQKYKTDYSYIPIIALRTTSIPLLSGLYGSMQMDMKRYFVSSNDFAMWKGTFKPALLNRFNITSYASINTSFYWNTNWQELNDLNQNNAGFTHSYSIVNNMHNRWTDFFETDLTHNFSQRILKQNEYDPNYGISTNKLTGMMYLRFRDRVVISSRSGYNLLSKEPIQQKRFDPIVSEVRVNLNALNYYLLASYDLYQSRITGIDSYVNIDNRNNFSIRIGLNWQRPLLFNDSADIYGELTFNMGSIFNAKVGGRYDVVNNLLKEQKYKLSVNITDCWMASIIYRRNTSLQETREFFWIDIRLSAFPPSASSFPKNIIF